ncbi:hypothetical protein [Variovorax sp.]|uniref:hypothetical protein n=1 Tax=Variovorax sp. TaxID=1871043 RepID=UPI003BA9B3B0
METIDAIHRHRLALLIKEAGSQAKLATQTGKSAAQISQWLNASKDSKTGKPRAMDRNTAREFERACGKPSGWMDQPIGAPSAVAANEPSVFEVLTQEERELLDDLRVLIDEERDEIRMLVAERARKARAYLARMAGTKLPIVAKSAAERNRLKAEAESKVTERLHQQSLLEDK